MGDDVLISLHEICYCQRLSAPPTPNAHLCTKSVVPEGLQKAFAAKIIFRWEAAGVKMILFFGMTALDLHV